MDVRDLVREHYGTAGLADAVLAALSGAGVDVTALTAADLSVVDQLHAGGAAATKHVLDRLGVRPGLKLLDVGSGLGGPARMAGAQGADVTGVDLTPEFVAAANELTERTGLADRVRFVTSPGESLPFDDDSFEAAVMVHVGMNVPAKQAVFEQVHRVLSPGATFALYDQMSTGRGDLTFPLPWAEDPRGSFLESVDDYRRQLESAGFHVDEIEDRTEAVLVPPPASAVGPGDIFGAKFSEGVGNYVAAARAGLVRAVLVLASA
jgi:SAM-dependent methyltransferase